MRNTTLSLISAAVLLGGCSGTPPGKPSVAAAAPKSRYDLANHCYALKSQGANAFVVRDSSAGYTASAAAVSGAEPFYLKPTALGRYMLYSSDKMLMTANGTAVDAVSEPVDGSDWVVNRDAQGRFTIVTRAAGDGLSTSEDGTLVTVAGTAGSFDFVPTTGCTSYPEMPVDVEGDTYKGNGVDKPVIGFAEVHTHMAMGNEMSDGTTPVGPTAGGALYGQMFNRFGVTEALKDCAAYHGTDGTRDPEAIILDQTPGQTHDTQGWPTFVDWPAATSMLHQAMYYKWVERAWKAGLRIMVSEGTNIEALCEIARDYESQFNPLAQTYECKDMELGVAQVKYLKQLQDYVDAQEGGPGKGWFRIVGTPQQAREVINEGKLAVVPGLEFSNLFHCTVKFNPDGSETDGCTKEEIDAEIQEVWDLGVRELFPYHDVNSALGGTGIFDGLALNLVGFYGTNAFWKTYDCPNTGEGDSYFYNAGAVMQTAIPQTGSDPITQAIIDSAQGVAPTYPPDKRQCNARGMTDLGRYVLEKLMEKHFIIDIDHAELSIKQDMLDMGAAQNPPYPMISAHGGHGGITMNQAKEILDNGGLIYPMKPNGQGYVEFMNKLKPIWPQGKPMAVGYGMDANGIANRAGPRSDANSKPVQYPFTLFQGPDWGPQFAAAGIRPLTFDLQTIPESGKYWNIDEVGTAHYGMVADYVEEIRLEGGEEALDALYNSAEAYIEMWERTVNR